MSNKKQILSKITKSLNNAIKAKSKDLCTFCKNMLEANEEIDNLAEKYKGEKNEKSISKRYFDWSDQNKEFPLQRFNGIINFVNNSKNKQSIVRIFKESSIVQISKLVKKALQAFDYLMKKIGDWDEFITFTDGFLNKEANKRFNTYSNIYKSEAKKDYERKQFVLNDFSDKPKETLNETVDTISDFFGYERASNKYNSLLFALGDNPTYF